MGADQYYLVHGLVVASEIELPLPTVEPQSVDVHYRISSDGRVPTLVYTRPDDQDDPLVLEHWTEDGIALEFRGIATFGCTRTEVGLLRDDSFDPDLISHLLVDHVLPRVVALRGDLMLHAAGAVGPGGRAHLFLGSTGAGKSSLVTSLVAAGWALLDDDAIRVTRSGDGFRAIPGTPDVRLLPDAAAALVPEIPAGGRLSAHSRKRRFALDGEKLRTARAPALIQSLYLLERGDESEPTLEPLGPAEAVGAIADHGFHLADDPTAVVRIAFEHATELASAVAVWRLRFGANFAELDSAGRLVSNVDVQPDVRRG